MSMEDLDRQRVKSISLSPLKQNQCISIPIFTRHQWICVEKTHVCIADCDGLISASIQMPTHLLTYFHSSAGQGEKIG